MEAVMKSIVPAALAVVLIAGFIASVAALPDPVVTLPVTVELATRRPPSAPGRQSAPTASAPTASAPAAAAARAVAPRS
jgi:hypothetical protein